MLRSEQDAVYEAENEKTNMEKKLEQLKLKRRQIEIDQANLAALLKNEKESKRQVEKITYELEQELQKAIQETKTAEQGNVRLKVKYFTPLK